MIIYFTILIFFHKPIIIKYIHNNNTR